MPRARPIILTELLERNGWPRKEIFNALSAYYAGVTGIETPRRESGIAQPARDAFLYLLSFITLGVWTVGLVSLFFTVIDSRFRDFLTFQAQNFRDSASGSMASVIVAFPIYLVTMRVLLAELRAKPEKAQSAVRKWLTYIALLLSAAVVICDLVTVVTYLLRGSWTTPFILKVVVVFVVAAGVFVYYLVPLQTEEAQG